MKKVFKKLVSSFLFLALGLLVNIRNLFADGEGVWSMVGEPSGIPAVDYTALLPLKGEVVAPLSLIGVASYALALLYKVRKRDMKSINHIMRLGTVSLIVAFIAFGVAWFYENDLGIYMIDSSIILFGFQIVSWAIMLIAGIYSFEYIWGLAKKDLPARKK